jgi:MFS family permease
MNTTTTPSIETRFGWVVVLACHIMVVVAFGAAYLMVIGIKPIATEFGWPRWVPSLGYASVMLGSGIGGIAMGAWSDRHGMGGPALTGAIFIGLGAMTMSVIVDQWTFLATAFIMVGFLGNGAVLAPLMTLTSRWFDRRRGLAIAITGSGQGLAGALWPTIFQAGLEDVGWRQVWFWYGIFALFALTPLVLILRRPPPVPSRPAPGFAIGARDTSVGLKGSPRFILTLLSIAIVGCCIAMAMPLVHIVSHASDLGYTAAHGAQMLSILLGCAFVSRLFFGWFSDRVGGLRTILIGSTMQAIVLSFFIWNTDLTALYVLSALFGTVFGGIVPAYAMSVRDIFPARNAGGYIGVVLLFGTVGMAAGGWLGGLINDLTGYYKFAFATGLGANIVNLFIIAALIRMCGSRRDPMS